MGSTGCEGEDWGNAGANDPINMVANMSIFIDVSVIIVAPVSSATSLKRQT